MKRFISAVLLLFSALSLCFCAGAESGGDLLSGYSALKWSGAPLVYNAEHKTLSFSEENEAEAFIEFPVGDAKGFSFYADFGNYKNAGAGSVKVSVINSGGEIQAFEPEIYAPDGSFRRYRLGTGEANIPLPEDAENIRVTLISKGGKSPSFRNLSLTLTSAGAISSDPPEWEISGKLELVQVKVSKSDYWIWAAIIMIVPIGFYALKKARDNVKKIK